MREPLSYEIASRAAEAALDAARAEGERISVTVVNRSGITKVVLADDGAGPIAVSTSRLKAYTAAVMGITTAEFAEVAASPVMAANPVHLVDPQLHPVPGDSRSSRATAKSSEAWEWAGPMGVWTPASRAQR